MMGAAYDTGARAFKDLDSAEYFANHFGIRRSGEVN
jgi:hypothetical protein